VTSILNAILLCTSNRIQEEKCHTVQSVMPVVKLVLQQYILIAVNEHVR